jgi:hypothetical protein
MKMTIDGAVRISHRVRNSTVWLLDGYVYKCAPKVLIDTERWFLDAMAESGYVPAPVKRIGLETLRMPFIEEGHVTDGEEFLSHLEHVLDALKDAECRHGDLTTYSVIVSKDNRPILIDFSESRHMDSPLPDKRPEGDRYWLTKTMDSYAGVTYINTSFA